MNRLRKLCLLFLFAATSSMAADPHVHGVGSLDVALQAHTLALHFESPLDSLVGFEREPKNDAEREAVRRMANTFRQARRQFVPSPAAQCRVTGSKLASPVLKPDSLDHEHEHHEAEHAELVADVIFRCADAAALDSLEVRLFDRFKRLRRLDVQMIGPHGQSAATLTPEARRLDW